MSSKLRRHTVRFPTLAGIIAAAPKAWSEVYDILVQSGTTDREPFTVSGAYAVVDICGPLTQHAKFPYDDYDCIRDRVAAACASECKSVVLNLNSPGGDFAGAIELSYELRAMCDAADKQLIAFTDSQCASAAYAIACAADEIVITPSAFVGSIGVWATLVDTVAADRAMGTNIVIVASGSRKVDHNPHVAITEGAVDALRVQVDEMAALFFDLVTTRRNLSADEVKGLKGAEVFGAQALAVGLADRMVNCLSDLLSNPATQTAAQSRSDTMASKYEAARAALAAAAEGDDDDAKKAKKALLALDEKDEKKEDKKEEAKAESEGEDEADAKAAAESDDKDGDEDMPEKKMKKKASAPPYEDKKAAASAEAAVFELAAELQRLKAQMSAEKENAERAALLASRPDFAPEIRKTLAAGPMSMLRKACAEWPRVTNTQPAATAVPGGTRGSDAGDTGYGAVDPDWLKAKMQGNNVKATGVRNLRNGHELELGFMTPEQAARRAKELAEKDEV